MITEANVEGGGKVRKHVSKIIPQKYCLICTSTNTAPHVFVKNKFLKISPACIDFVPGGVIFPVFFSLFQASLAGRPTGPKTKCNGHDKALTSDAPLAQVLQLEALYGYVGQYAEQPSTT